ncbi:MAG: ion transporter [Spirochaetota bacterium]
MMIKPLRLPFLVKAADAVNPYIVMVSIAGLILEFTPLKTVLVSGVPVLIMVNHVIDIIFVLDFVVRMATLPIRQYFFKGYGWIDLLASIPGIALIFQGAMSFFATFKVTRIGRFFKIIRLLRFLRIFSFLNRMKGDSAFVQERIMKIGVSIVLVFIVGIALTDHFTYEHLIDLRVSAVQQKNEAFNRDVGMTRMFYGQKVLFYTEDGAVYSRDGSAVTDQKEIEHLFHRVHGEIEWNVVVPLSSSSFIAAPHVKLPLTSIVITSNDLMFKHDVIMLILIATLVGILLVIIMYMGYIFAHDMRHVHLIIDSIDANDYMLLEEEARGLSPDGSLAVIEGEDEIRSLVKMTAKLARLSEASPSAAGTEIESGTLHGVDADTVRRLVDEALAGKVIADADTLAAMTKAAAVDAVTVSTKTIAAYIKKHIGR